MRIRTALTGVAGLAVAAVLSGVAPGPAPAAAAAARPAAGGRRWPGAGAGPAGPGRVWVFDGFAPSRHPFAAFWNGKSWGRRPLPMSPLAVSALSPGNMWVVGESGLAVSVNGSRTGPLREAARHWDGRTWRTVPLP